MGRTTTSDNVFRVVVEYVSYRSVYNPTTCRSGMRWHAVRDIYGPWGNRAAATRKLNELQRRLEAEAKKDPSFTLFTLERQYATGWKSV